MEISPTSVFRKTNRAAEELRTRQHGLSPRLRQLLILVDGKRSVEEISRAMPQPELGSQLAHLERGGFVERGAQLEAPPRGAQLETPARVAQRETPGRAAQPAATPAHATALADGAAGAPAAVGKNPTIAPFVDTMVGVPREPQPAGAVFAAAAPPQPGARVPPTPVASIAPPPAPIESLHDLRMRVARALLETIGPNGDALAMRLERARTAEDVRALVPAILSVVEAVGGRHGVDRFLERCGGI